MKKLIKTGLIVIFLLSVLLFTFYMMRHIDTDDYRKQGKLLIDKIEIFRQLEKRLPNNVNELGLEEHMDEGPYYEKEDGITYMVYFNIGFDDAFVYCSNTKEWKKMLPMLTCHPSPRRMGGA